MAFPMRTSNGCNGGNIIGSVTERPPTRLHIEGGKLTGLPTNDRHSLRLQVFQREIQVKDRFCSCTDDKDWRTAQLCQIGRNVHARFSASMYSSDAARGEET